MPRLSFSSSRGNMKIAPDTTAYGLLDLGDDFRHEALFYGGLDGFVEGTSTFVREGLEAGELPYHLLDEAHRSHPYVWQRGLHTTSPTYRDLEAAARPFDVPLPPPPPGVQMIILDVEDLHQIRNIVARAARTHGLDVGRTADLVLS